MILKALPALKVLSIVGTAAFATGMALEPTVQVAIIAGGALLITNLTTVGVAVWVERGRRRDAAQSHANQQDLKESQAKLTHSVDGVLAQRVEAAEAVGQQAERDRHSVTVPGIPDPKTKRKHHEEKS